MAICTLQNVLDDARGLLGDTQVSGGEVFTNTVLQVPFSEPYRSMFGLLMGASKRVQRVAQVMLPANTTVLIPATAGITDFAEPEQIEERPATASLTISTTSNATPIVVTTSAPHGFAISSQGEGCVTGVSGTVAPWGNWGITVTGASTFTLNGSMTDGSAGTGGAFYGFSSVPWNEVIPVDLPSGIDGQQQQSLVSYMWIDEQLRFRGATQNTMLRLLYYASGNPPTNPATNINIDNCRDFLAFATAGNAAQTKGWWQMADRLMLKAYQKSAGIQGDSDGGLLGIFRNIQVMAQQRNGGRRNLPFRDHRSRFGGYLLS